MSPNNISVLLSGFQFRNKTNVHFKSFNVLQTTVVRKIVQFSTTQMLLNKHTNIQSTFQRDVTVPNAYNCQLHSRMNT